MNRSGGRRPLRPIVVGTMLLLLACLHSVPRAAQLSLLTPAEQDAQLAMIAAEAARRGPVTPVPLLGNGSRALGALYDQFHVGVLIARAQIAANQSADAAAIGSHPLWQSRGVVIVAYPITCDGKPNQPLTIKVTGPSAISGATPIGEAARGATQRMLPGISLPDDALVQSFRNLPPIGGAVEIDYAGPACGGAAKTARLDLEPSPSKSLLAGMLGVKLPDDLKAIPTPATVRMQVLLDVDGSVRFAKQVQGALELAPAANALLNSRKFDPWAVNGVAVPQWTIAPIVFTATGEPARPDQFRPGAMPGQMATTGVVTIEANPRMPPPPVSMRPPLPPAPPGQSDTFLAQLAIELAQKRAPTPISMDAAGPPVHGVLFDRFLIGAVRARAAVAAGSPMDPAAASPALVREGIAVAFPLACPSGPVAPTDVQISISIPTSNVAGQPGAVFTGSALAERLPGVALPEGAIGRAFSGATFAQNAEVRITYADRACPGDSNTVTLPIQYVRGGSMGRLPFAKLPPEAASLPSPTTVQIRGLVDQEGRYRFPTLAEGPPELAQAAQAAAASWRFEPYRANGAPTPTFVITSLTFTTTGIPEPPSGAASSVVSSLPVAPPAPMANTTVGGRPTTISSADVPGLTPATSKCAIADDDAYGLTPAGAIKVGGGAREGPALERQYLSALRGPAGQGLRAARLGSTLMPDGTILDIYEVAHSGLAQPVRLYLDEYHTETLKAPKGFTCAATLQLPR